MSLRFLFTSSNVSDLAFAGRLARTVGADGVYSPLLVATVAEAPSSRRGPPEEAAEDGGTVCEEAPVSCTCRVVPSRVHEVRDDAVHALALSLPLFGICRSQSSSAPGFSKKIFECLAQNRSPGARKFAHSLCALVISSQSHMFLRASG